MINGKYQTGKDDSPEKIHQMARFTIQRNRKRMTNGPEITQLVQLYHFVYTRTITDQATSCPDCQSLEAKRQNLATSRR